MLAKFVAWLLGQVQGLFTAIDNAIPAVPDGASGVCSGLAGLIDAARPWLGIVPLSAIGVAIGIVVASMVAGMVITTIRIGASFATLGGGAV